MWGHTGTRRHSPEVVPVIKSVPTTHVSRKEQANELQDKSAARLKPNQISHFRLNYRRKKGGSKTHLRLGIPLSAQHGASLLERLVLGRLRDGRREHGRPGEEGDEESFQGRRHVN